MGTRKRIVVVGGDAAGMSAASTAKRAAGDDVEIIAFERGQWTSYSACGIPYWVGGEVSSPHDLVARTPEEHRSRGIDVRLGTSVTSLDADAGRVSVRDEDGRESEVGYDDVVLATGAEPIVPDVPGVDAAGIHVVHTLDDGARVLADLDTTSKRVVIVGGGYVGLEMAEAGVHLGLDTTLITRSGTPMTSLDPDMGNLVHDALVRDGIEVRTSCPARGFEVSDGRVVAVQTDDGAIPADLVLLGVGVRARSALADGAGLTTGAMGAIAVDSRQRADADRHVWAAGDCVETWHRLSQRRVFIPLGTHANKQGLVLGRNLVGADAEFPGVLGTAITKACSSEIARSGLGENDARDAGFDVETVTVDATTRAGYFPGAEPMTIKMVADRRDRRLLGAQIVGGAGAAKRIDTVATALWGGFSVDDVMFSDLSYAPPFSGVWDPVQAAARALSSRLGPAR